MPRRTSSATNLCEQIFTMRGVLVTISASPCFVWMPKIQRERPRQRWSATSPA
jgi:hypothetical protein